MQLMIDILAETPDALDLASRFLAEHAALRRVMLEGAGMPLNVPTGTSEAPPAPLAPAPAAVTPAALTPNNSTATVAPPPPVPPSPTNAPIAATPAIPAPPSPSSVAPALPGVSAAPPAGASVAVSSLPIPPTSTTQAASASQGAIADEFDRAGVPWDARIHQDGKSQKKDGTWKLRKKIDPAVVEAVMRELTPRIRVMNSTPTAPAAPPAPSTVSLPQAPPPPVQNFGEAPPPPATPTAYAAPPLAPPPPPAAVVPPAPGAETQTIDPFRLLVAKITKARAEKKLTPEEVTQAVTSAGVASLQLLNAMPHKVAEVEANVDAILVTR